MIVRKAFLVSLIGFAFSGIAYAQQETSMQVLMLGHASLYKTDRSFANIIIGDPKIVDVSATSDRTATMTALMTGATNVLFLDASGNPISEFEVVVSEPQQSRVRIHNKSTLMGNTAYRCAPTFCDFIDETITKEPPPQRPTTTTSSSETVSEGNRTTTRGTSVTTPP
jgi:hypothetical protein